MTDDQITDALAEALADEWVHRAATDRALCRIALRAVGRLATPDLTPWEDIAASLGTTPEEVRRIARVALAALRLTPEASALRKP